MCLIDKVGVSGRRGARKLFGVPTHDVENFRRDLQRLRGPDVIANGGDTAGIEGDRQNGEIPVLQLSVDALPDWQVEAASSPGGP
jgi:hypothetical protein